MAQLLTDEWRRSLVDASFNRNVQRADDMPIDAIFHAVRAGVFRMPTFRYRQELGIGSTTNLAEESDSDTHAPSVAKLREANRFLIFNHWWNAAIERTETEPEIAEILLRSREQLAALYTPGYDEKTYRFWRYLRYLAGEVEFDEDSPVDYNTIERRAGDDTVGKFSQLVTAVRNFGFLEEEENTAEAWQHPYVTLARQAHYTHSVEKGGDKCAVALLMMLEYVGEPTTMVGIEKKWKLPRHIARTLSQERRPKLAYVQELVDAVRNSNAVPTADIDRVLSVWLQEDGQSLEKSEVFQVRQKALMEQRDLSPSVLAHCHGLVKPGTNGDWAQSSVVTNSLYGREFSSKLPQLSFPLFTEGSVDDMRSAIAMRREEFRQSLERRWDAKRGHVHVERLLCGVELEELPFELSKLLAFENGESGTRLREDHVLKSIHRLGLEKSRAALQAYLVKRGRLDDTASAIPLNELLAMRMEIDGTGDGTAMPRQTESALMGPLPKPIVHSKSEGEPAMTFPEQPTLHALLERISVVRDGKSEAEKMEHEASIRNLKEETDLQGITTVQGLLIDIGRVTKGGMSAAQEQVPKTETETGVRCPSSDAIIRMARGETTNYASLVALEYFAHAHGRVLTDDIKADWSLKYADMLKGKGKTIFRRALDVMIAEVAMSQSDFCSNSTGISEHWLSHLLTTADTTGDLPWQRLQTVLREIGTDAQSPRWAFIEALHWAHEQGIEGEAILDAALSRWRRSAEGKDADIHPFHTPGIITQQFATLAES